MEKVDVLIIGAGVLGCFAARNLSRYKLDISVLEQREDVCTGISKANTGIIYQGYDQHPGSLKASLCVRASAGFQTLCEELDVAYRKCGLLMTSFGPRGDRALAGKKKQGEANRVEGLRILNAGEVYALEPFLRGGISHALYAENTFTVNPWELGIAAFENARANGAAFCFREKAVNIERDRGAFLVRTEARTFRASRVLCCAGMQADRLWETVGRPRIRIRPLAADYLVFDTQAGKWLSHILSVEPEEKGDGITLVPTVDGNILAGPTRRTVRGEPDASTDADGLRELKKKTSELLPGLPMDLIIRSFASARPNPYALEEDGSLSNGSILDFEILEEDGFYALVGIKTPGLTCANELGAYMTDRIIRSFETAPEINRAYDPIRKAIPRVSRLLEEDIGRLEELPPPYREIICRCRNVSRGEVVEAIRRGAVTIDGVKRRTGAGMGRCQGGVCMEKILHILAEEKAMDPRQVTKDGGDSLVLAPSCGNR